MRLRLHLQLLLSISTIKIITCGQDVFDIPDGFSIGAATSSYQVEGGWNLDGKSESNWDRIVHEKPWVIADRSTGDVAADTYHKYKEDIQLMKKIGITHYRFSLSWPRILPTGFSNVINHAGIKYYTDLIDELLANGIEPYVTIYHWDHPQSLEDLGGWTNELMVNWFADYARVVFKEFGPKVKKFITVNEPNMFCVLEYAGPPGKNFSVFGEYLCGHNVLKAHARVYHMYDKEFRQKQKGEIGIVLACQWYESLNKHDDSGEIAFQYSCGWFANPIFSKEGDYPEVMRKRIAENSKVEGLKSSRLPSFSEDWKNYIKGTADYFGLNHYTTRLTYPLEGKMSGPWYNDSGLGYTTDPAWEQAASSWLNVVPEGFGKILRKIRDIYNNPIINIMENGFSDNRTSTSDQRRINYLYSYMREMFEVMKEGCKIQCYTIWSFIDSMEWIDGYQQVFGLVKVDFDSPHRNRTLKDSAYWLSDVLQNGLLVPYEKWLQKNVYIHNE